MLLLKRSCKVSQRPKPVMYKVYPWGESDQTAFLAFIEKVKTRPDLKQKIISFDAGCYSIIKIEQLETEGFKYVYISDISSYPLEVTP